jgi:hypothetical protein
LPAIRQEILDTLERLKRKTGLPIKKLSGFLGLQTQKLSEWKKNKIRKEKSNIPKSHWSTPDERKAVVEFKKENMCLGYVRLAWLMIDRNAAFQKTEA